MQFRIPLYVHIATLFFLLFLVLGFALVSQAYRQTLSGNITHEQQSFKQQGFAVEQSLQLTITPVKASLTLLSYSPITSATTLPQRLSALPQLTSVLTSQNSISAIYIGYANGDFFLVRKFTNEVQAALHKKAPENTEFLVQSITSTGNKREGNYLFFDANLKQLESLFMPDYQYDPRTRIWYQEAQSSTNVVISRSYIFFTTQEPGSTLAIKTPAGNAVIGADFSMKNLSQFLEKMQRPQGSEVVLFDDQGQLIASAREMYTTQNTMHTLPLLNSLKIPVLDILQEDITKQAITVGKHKELNLKTANNESWVAYVISMSSGSKYPLYLSLLLPLDTLYLPARNNALTGAIVTVFFLLLMLPFVWYVAKQTAKPLLTLKKDIESIRNFDFEKKFPTHSHISEIKELTEAMNSMRFTIHNFISIDNALTAEHKFDSLLTLILNETLKAVAANGGIIYLRQDSALKMEPVRAFWQQQEVKGLTGIPLRDKKEHALRLAIHGLKVVETLDPTVWQRDFQQLAPFDKTHLLVAEPLISHRKEVIGLLVVVLPQDHHASHDIKARVSLIDALSGTAAVAIETQRLIDEQKHLLESFIELVAGAIDAKSAYTGGHCQRVPVLTQMLTQAACDQKQGVFADFKLDDDQWEAVHIASWLHDCGKVTTPEYIVDKATKLEGLYDRIHEIRMRFEVIKRDVHIATLKSYLNNEQQKEIENSVSALWKVLDDEFAFVAECNLGCENMAAVHQERLQEIAKRTWQRTLDDRLGISHDELERKSQTPKQTLPVWEHLLADKPEHLIPRPDSEQIKNDNPWGFKVTVPEYLYNRGEMYSLTVPYGTLTNEERFKINQHIIQTIIMLNKLPFPQHLQNVPEIAGGHHEKMDGSGYPKGLYQKDLSIPARIMAIADIFEALTARDRPYKSGKTITEALQLMKEMTKKNHIDRDLYILFVTSEIWREYAKQYLLPEQLTEVDKAALLDGLERLNFPQ
jgi:HD-GYP domain